MIDAAAREELVELSHYTTDRRRSGSKSHPLLAAKLHVAMALRILEAKKSQYYEAALRSLGKVRRLLLEGQAGAWEALVAEIRSSTAQTAFMPGFSGRGGGRSRPRSRTRAKRWKRVGVGRRRS